MGASRAHTLSQSISAAVVGAGIAFAAPLSARANVITDWDETATAVVMPMPPYPAQRVMGMVHVAMFDAVNSIERRYQPYLIQLSASPTTSKDAAAATAAALASGPDFTTGPRPGSVLTSDVGSANTW